MTTPADEIAVAIPLKVWQDPQGNPLLVFSEHLSLVFVGCWVEAGAPADYICRLTFNSAWAARSYRIEYLPYVIKEHLHRSLIYEVVNSTWLEESSYRRSKCYPEWRDGNKRVYHHYVVQGHDEYVEVIAEGFSEEIISEDRFREILPLLYQECSAS